MHHIVVALLTRLLLSESDLCSSLYFASSAGETESFKFSRADSKSFIVTTSSPLHSSSSNKPGEYIGKDRLCKCACVCVKVLESTDSSFTTVYK